MSAALCINIILLVMLTWSLLSFGMNGNLQSYRCNSLIMYVTLCPSDILGYLSKWSDSDCFEQHNNLLTGVSFLCYTDDLKSLSISFIDPISPCVERLDGAEFCGTIFKGMRWALFTCSKTKTQESALTHSYNAILLLSHKVHPD